MFKDLFKKRYQRKAPEFSPHASGAAFDKSTPGGIFNSWNSHNQISFGFGYTVAMNTVADAIKLLRESTDKIPDKGELLYPMLLESMADVFDYSKVDLPELVSWVVGIYSQPENVKICHSDAFNLAKDLVEKRISQDAFDEQLKKLRAQV